MVESCQSLASNLRPKNPVLLLAEPPVNGGGGASAPRLQKGNVLFATLEPTKTTFCVGTVSYRTDKLRFFQLSIMSKQPEQVLKVCSICAKKFEEWGNSAMPIRKGRCCNACADRVVIPARIAQMRAEKVNELIAKRDR